MFENLTPKQRDILIWLAKHLKTESYEEQFWWISWDAAFPREGAYLRIREMGNGEYKIHSHVDDTDLCTLEKQNYVTLVQQGSNRKGSVNQKSFDEYNHYIDKELSVSNEFDNLRRLLGQEQVQLLTEIWDHYFNHNQWVMTQVLHVKHTKTKVRSALRPLSHAIVEEFRSGNKAEYKLTLLGVLLTEQGKIYEDLLSRYLEYLSKEYQGYPEIERITHEDVEEALNLDKSQSCLLNKLIFLSDFHGGGSYGGIDGTWEAKVPHDIDEYPEIKDFKKYIRERAMRDYIYKRQRLIEEQKLQMRSTEKQNSKVDPQKVFVVHGHNEAIRETVARFLEKLDLNVIILHEQPSKGRTIIEMFVDYADVAFAVVLLTADDRGGPKEQPYKSQSLRARQNVVFELGFFLGKLERGNVCTIYEEGVEIPSDYDGVIFIKYDKGNGGWRLELAKELKAAGMPVDLNKVVHSS